MHAVRNLRLCTKDCLCLFVCPTGATDTEDGQIDFTKCLEGCRLCVDVCPSHAISLLPDNYPPQQEKSQPVKEALQALAASKARQERTALAVAQSAESPVTRQLARAAATSAKLCAEECFRESGYMLPQSRETRELLTALRDTPQPEDFPKEAVDRLLELLK